MLRGRAHQIIVRSVLAGDSLPHQVIPGYILRQWDVRPGYENPDIRSIFTSDTLSVVEAQGLGRENHALHPGEAHGKSGALDGAMDR